MTTLCKDCGKVQKTITLRHYVRSINDAYGRLEGTMIESNNSITKILSDLGQGHDKVVEKAMIKSRDKLNDAVTTLTSAIMQLERDLIRGRF